MQDAPPDLIPKNPSYTALDRILERVLDFFDEFEDLGEAGPEELKRSLGSLAVLKLRIASALWLFGDSHRAFLAGLPGDPEARQAALRMCEGDTPRSFIGSFMVDGVRHDEERMALCRLQAMAEFRYIVERKLGSADGVLIQVEEAQKLPQNQ